MSKEPGTHTNLISNQNQKDTAIYIDSLFCKKKKFTKKISIFSLKIFPKRYFIIQWEKERKKNKKGKRKKDVTFKGKRELLGLDPHCTEAGHSQRVDP